MAHPTGKPASKRSKPVVEQMPVPVKPEGGSTRIWNASCEYYLAFSRIVMYFGKGKLSKRDKTAFQKEHQRLADAVDTMAAITDPDSPRWSKYFRAPYAHLD